MIFAGCDPGNTGAVAIWDATSGTVVSVEDLPIIKVVIAKKERPRIVEDQLEEMFINLKDLYDCKMLCLEQPMGMPEQSAPRAFQFGVTYATIRTTARLCGLYVHDASPTVWKLQMQVSKDPAAICSKASRLYPNMVKQFYGVRGGFKHDRAEACILAEYGAKKIWPTVQGRVPLRKAFGRVL